VRPADGSPRRDRYRRSEPLQCDAYAVEHHAPPQHGAGQRILGSAYGMNGAATFGSSLADPPITLAEARAVDLGRDTTVCGLHGRLFTHQNVEGKVYFCGKGRLSFGRASALQECIDPYSTYRHRFI
jgi:hypothetical protein